MDNTLNMLLKTVFAAPAWVKEVILFDIKKHLESQFPSISSGAEEEVFGLYIPEITFKGKKELETHEHGHEMNVYKYLNSANNKLRIVDITLNNFWTLEESSRYLAHCIKNEYIKSPSNPVINASVFYLGGEIRLGEYVKRINLIDVTQLDNALRKQKEINRDTHSYQKLGNVLVDMGLVVNDDIVKILQIKDESQKRFIFTLNPATKSAVPSEQNDTIAQDFKELQMKIDKLSKENAILKEKLRAIFNIQSKSKC